MSASLAPLRPVPASDVSFNLWTQPWIPVTDRQNHVNWLSLRETLVRAAELRMFVDPSPLVIAGLQRLLAAIATDIVRPANVADLARLLQEGAFDSTEIDRFGANFAERFDLFSEAAPFLQSADIPIEQPKASATKTVAYLFPEEPTGTNVNHFQHGFDTTYAYSPATAALGLVAIPAFATSGGAGIKPSINGVPPLYILPVGASLFESLALSIVTGGFRPTLATPDDRPAWSTDPIVPRSGNSLSVGYLESLTYRARRVRLFPETTGGICTRSGESSPILVRRMIYEMGLSRPKDSEVWLDPFAAYRVRDSNPPVPIRPQDGKAIWREYANLTHVEPSDESASKAGAVIAPGVVQQLASLQLAGAAVSRWNVRCIGLRTDMKAKVFEWTDETLAVPSALLTNPQAQAIVEHAIARAEDWSRRLAAIHRRAISGDRDQHAAGRTRMLSAYWLLLAEPFRIFVQSLADTPDILATLSDWSNHVLETGQAVFEIAVDEIGNRGDALQKRADALRAERVAHYKQRKDWNL